MRACHKTQHVTVAPQAPTFVAVMTELAAIARPATRTVFLAPTMPPPAAWADEVYGPS